MVAPQLEFLKNEAGETEGLADAGIETFRDAPYASCAREAGQNARDAADELPVKMTFNVIQLRQADFPAYEQLLSSLKACAGAVEQEKEREFFANALAVANRATIPVLEIADYNTKGLGGPPDQPGTPFHSLVKAAGVSTKESETSGGSFGIGKNASFAVSDLQMVFYSTCYIDHETRDDTFAAQGKIKLVSHRDSRGTDRRATGYWGDPGRFQAITNTDLIPVWMQRHKKGTSIFVMGFRESEDWAEHITSSLVLNFFSAIHREEMVFEVGKDFQINKNTLEGLLSREEVRQAAEKSGHLPDLEFASQLYRCLISPNAIEKSLSIDGLGDVRIRVLLEEGLPRRLGFIRNGMLITDNLRHFGQPLVRFPGSRDFVALVEPANDSAGKLLKRLENPAHDNFSAQRIVDPAKRAVAESAMRKCGRLLRDVIKESTCVDQQESVILDELGRLFADPGRADLPPEPNAERDPETYMVRPPQIVRRPRPKRSPTGGDEGGRPGTGTGSGGRGGGRGPLPGAGTGGSGRRGESDTIQLKEVRNTIRRTPSGEAISRLLFFSSKTEGEVQIQIQATGVNAPETLTLTHTDLGKLEDGALIVNLISGVRYRVVVTFDEPYEGPVELVATKVQNQGASV